MNNNDLYKKIDQNPEIDPIKDPTEAKKVVPTSSQGVNPPLKMTDVGQLISFLDQLPEKTKIRIIFKDYHNWVNFLPYYQKYKEKFNTFRDKKEFIMDSNLVISKQDNIPLKESLIKWLEQNKINEQIKNILLEEIK